MVAKTVSVGRVASFVSREDSPDYRVGEAAGVASVVARTLVRSGEVEPHAHDRVQFIAVTNGHGIYVSDATQTPVSKGSVLIVRAGKLHSFTMCHELITVDVGISTEVLGHELRWLVVEMRLTDVLHSQIPNSTNSSTVTDSTIARLEAWGHELQRPAARGDVDRAMRLGFLTLFVGVIAAALGEDSSAHLDPHRSALLASRILEEDIAMQWTLAKLAQAVNLAPTYLVRVFRKHKGLPPMAYLNRIRADRVRELLIETDLPIAEIGRLVGWNDPSYVSRRFKQIFASSPAQYRALRGRHTQQIRSRMS